MPQKGSVGMMLSAGQYSLLRSYADTREIPVSVQSAINHLVLHSENALAPAPKVEEAIGFIDWLSANEEITVTLDENLYTQIGLASKLCEGVAKEHYTSGFGKRKKVPKYYRDGFFLASLLGNDYVVDWAQRHERFGQYKAIMALRSRGTVSQNRRPNRLDTSSRVGEA